MVEFQCFYGTSKGFRVRWTQIWGQKISLMHLGRDAWWLKRHHQELAWNCGSIELKMSARGLLGPLNLNPRSKKFHDVPRAWAWGVLVGRASSRLYLKFRFNRVKNVCEGIIWCAESKSVVKKFPWYTWSVGLAGSEGILKDFLEMSIEFSLKCLLRGFLVC